MKVYDFQNFEEDLEKWMHTRFLDPILNIEGGWEHWIQIDFPAWLDGEAKSKDPSAIPYDFRREVSIPSEHVRLDWLVNSQPNSPVIPTALEIKAQTPKYLNKNFVVNVRRDVTKLLDLDLDCDKIMLIAVIDDRTSTYFTERGFDTLLVYNDALHFLMKKLPSL